MPEPTVSMTAFSTEAIAPRCPLSSWAYALTASAPAMTIEMTGLRIGTLFSRSVAAATNGQLIQLQDDLVRPATHVDDDHQKQEYPEVEPVQEPKAIPQSVNRRVCTAHGQESIANSVGNCRPRAKAHDRCSDK